MGIFKPSPITTTIQTAVDEATQDSFLVHGGQVVWSSDYIFRVSAADYYIQGTAYSSAEQTIELDAADATNDRIDVIAVDTTGTVVKITGTAAAQPSEPDIDPSTQLKLAFVLVTANTTEPASVANVTLYAENAGSGGGEWDWTTSGSGWNVNSITNPHAGTKTIEGTSVANNAYAQGAKGSGTIDPNSYDFLVLFVRSKATWNNNRVLRLQFQSSGVKKGNTLTLASGYWGFDSSNTADYQQVAIPISQFAVPAGTTINQLRIADSGGAIGVYIDDIAFQTGAVTPSASAGLTQAQADAKYLQSAIVLAIGDDTTAITAGTAKLTFRMPFAMTLTGIRANLATAQASGSTFTVDVNEGGSTILSTKLTIDNGEETSTTAATPAVISDTALADDAEITIDVDQVGNGTAAGLKVTLIGAKA
jgi:hypothetical protein